MTPLTEGNRIDDVLRHEAPAHYSREKVTILAGSGAARALKLGQVLGKVPSRIATADADAGNTGDGAMGAVTAGCKARAGIYKLECIASSADAGTFEVLTPEGYKLPDLTVGAAYAGDHLNMTLADGAADFVVGDKFSITVTPGSAKYRDLDLTGTDGSQFAAGILLADATAADGTDGVGVALVRQAQIVTRALVWPAGATDAQKAQALSELASLGIITREEV